MSKPEQPQTPEQSKEVSIYDRLKQLGGSKKAQAMFLLVTLGIGAAVFEQKREKATHEREVAAEKERKHPIDLGSLEGLVDETVQVPSTDGTYIIHIGQFHGGETLKDTLEAGIAPVVIDHQKKIEQIMLLLKEKYGVKRFHMESFDTTEGTFVEYCSNMQKDMDQARREGRLLNIWEGLLVIPKRIQKNVGNHLALGDRAVAAILYYVQCRIQEELEAIKHADAAYTSALAALGKDRSADLIDRLQIEIDMLKNHPFLVNDRISLAGAHVKLLGEREIEIAAGDDGVANQALAQLSKETNNFETREDEFIAINNRREATAVRFAGEDIQAGNRFSAIVIGDGHDLSDEARKQNIGLIKLTPHFLEGFVQNPNMLRFRRLLKDK